MSAYCGDCYRWLFGRTGSDFAGLLSQKEWDHGYTLTVLCEGCMWTEVDPEGECLGGCSSDDHGSLCRGLYALPHEVPGVSIRFGIGTRVAVNSHHPMFPGARGVITDTDQADSELPRTCAVVRRTPDGPIVSFHVVFEKSILLDHSGRGDLMECAAAWIEEEFLTLANGLD